MQPFKRALIFANGLMEKSDWLLDYIQPDDYLIAADGGYSFLQSLSRQPHLLIGDLDSVTIEQLDQTKTAQVQVIQYPTDKDQTDLELALNTAVEKGFQCIRIIAALGGRLDQTLGNVFLLVSSSLEELDVRIENGDEQIFLVRRHAVIHGEPGDIVSLLPILGAAERICTSGLKYPLVEETLFPQHTRGISNVLVENQATITLENGLLICVHLRSST